MYRRDVTVNLEWFGYSLLAVLLAALFLPLWGGNLARRLLLIVPGLVLAVVILVSARTGARRSVAIAGVAGAWIMLTASAWTGGGVASPSYLAYLIPILAAGVLLGWRAAAVVFVLSLCSGLLLATAEVQGWLPADVVVVSAWSKWSSRSLVLAMALAILYGADATMTRAFARSSQEVEERKRAEREARETAQRLRLAMQAARMAAWEWDIDHDRLTWSDEAPALFGRPAAALASNTGEAIARVHPDDRDAFYRTALMLQATPDPGPVRLSQRLVAADGSIRWFEELGQYFPATEDRPARIVGVIFDVSERRRMEEVQAAVARGLSTQFGADFFRSLVGHLADALTVDIAFVGELVGDGSRVRTVGVSEGGRLAPDFEYDLRGAPCEQVVGHGICSYPSGVQQRFPADRALAAKGIEGYAGQPLRDAAGRPMGLLVVMSRRPLQNLSELESILQIFAVRAATELERTRAVQTQAALENQLRQSQRMETIGQLAGGVAHDFNNLLSPILGYADLLLGDVEPGDRRRDYLQTIKDAAERAAALTRQLLTFSRRQLRDLKTFELNEAVEGFEKILRRTIREDIAIVFRYATVRTFVRGDVSQVEQILMNLVVNAQDAMPAGGTIVVETAESIIDEDGNEPSSEVPPGHYVALTVSDTGVGMPPEVMQHVFEPFFTTKERGRGTGLGLATVNGIVRQHRGCVTIDSTPGAGTTVTVRLPVTEPEAQPATVQEASTTPPPIAAETVVVVEDDDLVRELASAVLRQHGYHVVDYPDAQQCLDRGVETARRAALLLTDIIMPGLNGRQLYDRLRERCPNLKVLYMSGYAGSVIADSAVGQPAVALLPKPFTVEALVGRVREAIAAPPVA